MDSTRNIDSSSNNDSSSSTLNSPNTINSSTATASSNLSTSTAALSSHSTPNNPTISSEPQKLIDWSNVTLLLEQVIGNGIECALLFKLDGTLLTVAGRYSLPQQKLITALVANVWKLNVTTSASSTSSITALSPNTLNKQSSTIDNAQSGSQNTTSQQLHLNRLESMVIECDNGSICVCQVSEFLLGLYSNDTTCIGLVEHKLNLAADALKPLYNLW